ncbi:MAG TPA: carbonic anhydrase [Syntrophales bacterium]|nr:carbonic anhydrase [Syntrophales bacterium]HOL58668.1 carbonic anhydrase [Syntrophales bacterium]HPO35044.1 carbonic anhydrase [Syntrophales bacterium]
MIEKNVKTDFVSAVYEPVIDPSTYVHPLAAVIGHVILGKNIMVAPFAAVRGDEGHPIFVGDNSNIQDGVVIHALETEKEGNPIEQNLITIDGEKYAVYVGKNVSCAHQAQIHGPAAVLDGTFIGMKSLVFRSIVEENCVVEPGCILVGVRVAARRYVPAGSVVTNQEAADRLPMITEDYPLKSLNKGVLHVNTTLAREYLKSK